MKRSKTADEEARTGERGRFFTGRFLRKDEFNDEQSYGHEPKESAARYRKLGGWVRERTPAHTPDWTDYRESDPGITVLELLVFSVTALAIGVSLKLVFGRRRARSRFRCNIDGS